MLFISEHVSTYAHQLIPKYTIFLLYKMYSDNVSFRRAEENCNIKLLNPKLNKTQSCMPFLYTILSYRYQFKRHVLYGGIIIVYNSVLLITFTLQQRNIINVINACYYATPYWTPKAIERNNYLSEYLYIHMF